MSEKSKFPASDESNATRDVLTSRRFLMSSEVIYDHVVPDKSDFSDSRNFDGALERHRNP
jgi:hypothetical protein